MSAVVNVELPSWLTERIDALNDAGRERLTLWLLRAITRDVRLSGGLPVVPWPRTVEEALWGLTEGPTPEPVSMAVAAITVADLPAAAWRWIGGDLDGPNSHAWRTEVVEALLDRAKGVSDRMPVGLGSVVYDTVELLNGVVIEHLPATAKGWRTYEMFVVRLENNGIVQRTRQQLRQGR